MTAPTPDLESIRARHEAATSGPWRMRDVGYVFAADTSERAAESGYDGTPIADTFMWLERGKANQVFIAHAREDIPALLAALAAVTTERDQALEALAAANKLGAFETGKTIGAAEVRNELDQARQMLADEKQRADLAERSRHEAWDALYKLRQGQDAIKTSPGGVGYVRPSATKKLPGANV